VLRSVLLIIFALIIFPALVWVYAFLTMSSLPQWVESVPTVCFYLAVANLGWVLGRPSNLRSAMLTVICGRP